MIKHASNELLAQEAYNAYCLELRQSKDFFPAQSWDELSEPKKRGWRRVVEVLK